MSDPIDEAGEVITRAMFGLTTPSMSRKIAYYLHTAGLLVTPAHDAAVAAKALRGWVSGHYDDPHDDDYCDEWVRGYHAAMRSVLTAAGHMEREGGGDVRD